METNNVNKSTSKTPLSVHDKEVLTRIFSADFPYEDDAEDKPVVEEKLEEEVISEEVKKAKALEIQGVQAAEKGDLEAALVFFNQAVEVAPNWASAYNNRAQCLHLKMDTAGALVDLDKAVELSEGKGKVACNAYTQRAIIKRIKASDEEALEDFKKAAALGSEFAKEQAIKLNPIAALCNAMMCEMMQKVKEGVM